MADIFEQRYNEECIVCGGHPCLSDCPEFLLDNDIDDIKPIASLFENYIVDNDILNNELTNQIGNHFMIIADALLKAQKDWESKTYMNRLQEVIGNFHFYADFTETLNDAGAFDTVEEVIEYIKNPQMFDKLYNFWHELGNPSSQDEMFTLFRERVIDYKNLQ